ncbi:MAG: permease [Acidimicrobiales bacterium]
MAPPLAAEVPIVVLDAGRSLREAFFMFWETLWALVLGFGLSGAVQAFVTRGEMQRVLGDHRPAAVARASALGMASSSCSYAASAMSRALFRRGADFLAAIVFMVASTNLVIELGIVLAVLLGWQFLLGEFVGGPIMIVLVVALGALFIPPRLIAAARAGHDDVPDEGPATSPSWHKRLGSRRGWADAAGYTFADLRMVRRELVIGYGVAGVLAVVVPVWLWHGVFVNGHGVWSEVENAVVGPVIAFASFVCSIGNVPLAAALWHGGIAFGGVVSFVFADLLAAPLVLIYRRYYGGALTVRLVLVLWAAMAAAGLAVQGIFSAAGLVPATRPVRIVPEHFSWGATTVLNILAVLVLCALALVRRGAPEGTAADVAVDPVCHMQVDVHNAPATAVVGGTRVWFCSEGCRDRYLERAGAGASDLP